MFQKKYAKIHLVFIENPKQYQNEGVFELAVIGWSKCKNWKIYFFENELRISISLSKKNYVFIGYALSTIKNFWKGASKKVDGPTLATPPGSPHVQIFPHVDIYGLYLIHSKIFLLELKKLDLIWTFFTVKFIKSIFGLLTPNHCLLLTTFVEKSPILPPTTSPEGAKSRTKIRRWLEKSETNILLLLLEWNEQVSIYIQ